MWVSNVGSSRGLAGGVVGSGGLRTAGLAVLRSLGFGFCAGLLCCVLPVCVVLAFGLCVGVSSALLDTTARHAPTVAGCVRTRSKLRLRGCVQGYSWAAASQGSLRARLGSGGTCLPAALHGAASKSLVSCVRGALL